MAVSINGTTGISGVDGSASAPAIKGTDANSGISYASDTVNINTGGATRATVNSAGRFLVGTTTAGDGGLHQFTIGDSSHTGITLRGGTSSNGNIYFADGTSGADEYRGYVQYQHGSDALAFGTAAATRMLINSGGRVLIGTASPVANGVFEVVGNIGFNDCLVGYRRTNDDTSNRAFTRFQSSNGTQIGFIGMGSSSVSYNTSSDYRIKENVVAISDGITRLKTLKPSRFNFLSDTSTTLDGFLAHEVSSIVPEAITGEKDAVDSDDKPIYQGIDQSKLVPLLTAALQEAIAKIETLETKVAALEAG